MIPVKICGITNLEDALFCSRYGAAALGFIFAESKRKVTPAIVFEITKQITPFIIKVGVFVNEDPLVIKEIMRDCRLDLAQLHGKETPDQAEILEGRVIKAFRAGLDQDKEQWRGTAIRGILVDAYSPHAVGGTGTTFDWKIFSEYQELGFPTILAGGLNDQNIMKALETTKPDGVDVSSGIEFEPGKKDLEKVRRFFDMIRGRSSSGL